MRKFFFLQAIIVMLGVVSLLLVRNNVDDYGILVTGDETAVAALPASLRFYYNEDADASWVRTAEEQRAALQKAHDFFGTETMVLLAESKGENRYASGCALYSMEIKQVLEGDTALEGQNIQMVSSPQSQILASEYDGRRGRDLWFRNTALNYLKKGHTYLMAVYVDPLPGGKVTQYTISNLCYDLQNTENRLIDSPHYVYSDCPENEVFYCKQEMVDAYYQAKQDMFDYYGISPKDVTT
ncbi:MAG: hypothetical protein PUC41_07215 [Oscillospiraceae bacterium]|nr:hypothetical protein [Oscillospiraceae bacterium]